MAQCTCLLERSSCGQTLIAKAKNLVPSIKCANWMSGLLQSPSLLSRFFVVNEPSRLSGCEVGECRTSRSRRLQSFPLYLNLPFLADSFAVSTFLFCACLFAFWGESFWVLFELCLVLNWTDSEFLQYTHILRRSQVLKELLKWLSRFPSSCNLSSNVMPDKGITHSHWIICGLESESLAVNCHDGNTYLKRLLRKESCSLSQRKEHGDLPAKLKNFVGENNVAVSIENAS